MYAVARQPNAAVVFGQVFTRIVSAFMFVGLGVCLFAGEAIAILGGSPYASAVWYVAPVVLACFCQGGVSLMDAGLYIKRRTGLKLGVTAAATLVMVALYAMLIPVWGAKGAAIATLGGFGFLALATYVVSQRIFPVCYPWPRIAGLLGLACGVWLLGQTVPEGGWSLPARVVLWLSAPVLAWFGGLITPEEKRTAWQAIGLDRADAEEALSPVPAKRRRRVTKPEVQSRSTDLPPLSAATQGLREG
jgi:O-antigen/teichoic acid export membrane protein